MENLERNIRVSREGKVVGAGKMNKTIIVAVEESAKSGLYKKVANKMKKFKVHDEKNEAGLGDKVLIEETRHISKDKYFRLVEIIEKAK